ncbi:(2Fe-2S)-binding protein [Ideonella sp. BN130291]|nr:(2Fe-2S)-binding protein [Ideonella sp. BN130291]
MLYTMIVCLCHRISDRDITQAVKDGVPDFETLQDETCIARNCGCCEECARGVFEQACATITVHRPQRERELTASAFATA